MALAALVVRIGADLTNLNKGLTQTEKDVQRTGKRLVSLGDNLTTKLTLPILAVGTAFVASAVHAGEFADRLLDLVDMTGLSSKTLQEFRHVETLAGVATDTLADSAIRLTSKMSSGGEQTKQLSDALKRLGLRATDSNGRLVSMDVLLPDIITRLQGMRDVTLRNTIASDIFGKSWSELAPVLGMGADAMTSARKEAEALGLVMSVDALEAANQFRIKLATLEASVASLVREIGGMALPMMQSLVSVIQDNVVPAVRAVAKWFDELSPTTKTVIGVVAGLAAAFGPLLVVVGTIMKFWPLLTAAFTALTGPIGLTVLAIGSLTAAGIQMVKHWDATKLQFTLAWTAMKDAAFYAVDKILAVVAGMARAFHMSGLADSIMELQGNLRILADEQLAKAGVAIATLEIKMDRVATATTKVTAAVTKLGTVLAELPSVDPMSLIKLESGFADAAVSFAKKPPDSLGAKVGQVVQSGSGGGEGAQMVQAFAAFGPLAVLLPIISGALESLQPVITALIEPLVEIGRVIGDALAPVFKMLTPIIKLVADLLIHQLAPVLKVVVFGISYFMEALGFVIRGIGKLVDALPFVSAKKVINAGQAMMDAAEAARHNANATDTATDAVNSFASALSNIPRVLNINALRHMITGAGGIPGGGGGGGGTGGGGGGKPPVYIYGDMVTNITVPGAGDPKAVADAIGRAMERTRSRGGTSRIALAVR